MRSATEPATSATVMMAKVIWYIMNRLSGIVLASGEIEFDADVLEEHAVEVAEPGAVAGEGQLNSRSPPTASTR